MKKTILTGLLMVNFMYANSCLTIKDINLKEKTSTEDNRYIDVSLKTKEGLTLKKISIPNYEKLKHEVLYQDLNFDGTPEILMEITTYKDELSYAVFSLECDKLSTFYPPVLHKYKLDTNNKTIFDSIEGVGSLFFRFKDHKYYIAKLKQKLTRTLSEEKELDSNKKVLSSSYFFNGKKADLVLVAENYWSKNQEGASAKVYGIYEKSLHEQNKTVPSYVKAYDGYKSYKLRKDNKSIESLGRNSTLEEISAVIDDISTENLNNSYRGKGSKLVNRAICFDNIEILEKLKRKEVKFKVSHLNQAQRCSAKNAMKYLMKQNLPIDNNNYIIVQNAISDMDLESTKILLSNYTELKEEAIAFFEAIHYIKNKHKKEEFLTYLFTKKIDINLLYDGGKTNLLKTAICTEDEVMTRFFLEKGADTNIEYIDYFGKKNTIFSCAKDVKVMKLLVKYGAKASPKDLERSIKRGKEEGVKFLLAQGVEVTKDVLEEAFKSKNKTILSLFQNRNSTKLTPKELSELYSSACLNKNNKGIEKLIAMGYPPKKAKESIFGCLVNYASSEKYEDFFTFLLTKDIDINFTPKKGIVNNYNLLQRIIYQNYGLKIDAFHRRKIEKILAKGIDVNYQADKGETVMMQLLDKEYIDTAKYIYANSVVDLSLMNSTKNTLLHYAILDSELLKEVLEDMTKKGILKEFLNKQDKYGKTALHYAASQNNDSTKLLLEYGASNIRVDNIGATAFAYVKNKKNYNLLNKSSNTYSKFRAECNVLVGIEGKKEYQSSCINVANRESMENLKVYYQFLGGDFKTLEKIGTEETYECQYHTFRHLGFFWVYKKDFKKAKKFFQKFVSHASNNHSKSYTYMRKIFFEDLDVFKNLYGEVFEKNAQMVLKEVDDFFVKEEK